MNLKTSEEYQIIDSNLVASIDITYVNYKRDYPDYVSVVVKEKEGGEISRFSFDLTSEGIIKLKEFSAILTETLEIVNNKL
jgi:hypothetical protein